MRLTLILLVALLAGCTFIDKMTSRQALPDTRIPLNRGQMIRDVPRADLERYRCRDGSPIYAESIVGSRWDIQCL